jgi:Ribosome 60S biogenesis N-terminal
LNLILNKFSSFQFILDLKLFIRKAAQSPEITSLVISSGVKPLEIVEIIKSNEKASSNVISSLYEMLKMVVIQLSNEGSNQQQNITDALKYLIRKNGTSIEMMLLSTVAHDKIIIFELFTFCLRYQPEFAIDIIKNVTFFTKPDDVLEQMRALKSENKRENFSLLRKSFVIMMIEFISNTNCGKRIIQKNNLFQFFLEGLHNDTNDTVREIIICLTEKVLLSSAFSKPEKLKIFSDEIIKNFLKVYELKATENVEEKIILVHEFLIRLLTNKKQGIAFKALTERYQNQRQSHVIGSFKTIWMKEYPSKLVIEIIKACPDLMQNILSKIAVGLMPKVSAQWFMCANFTQVLLSSFDPEEMMKFLAVLEPKKISSNIIKFSIPQFVLQNLGENALITQESLEVREKATQLLQIMLDKCCQYLRLVSKITTLKDFEQHRVKFDIINHIFTFFPSIETILNSLYRSINSQKSKLKLIFYFENSKIVS